MTDSPLKALEPELGRAVFVVGSVRRARGMACARLVLTGWMSPSLCEIRVPPHREARESLLEEVPRVILEMTWAKVDPTRRFDMFEKGMLASYFSRDPLGRVRAAVEQMDRAFTAFLETGHAYPDLRSEFYAMFGSRSVGNREQRALVLAEHRMRLRSPEVEVLGASPSASGEYVQVRVRIGGKVRSALVAEHPSRQRQNAEPEWQTRHVYLGEAAGIRGLVDFACRTAREDGGDLDRGEAEKLLETAARSMASRSRSETKKIEEIAGEVGRTAATVGPEELEAARAKHARRTAERRLRSVAARARSAGLETSEMLRMLDLAKVRHVLTES